VTSHIICNIKMLRYTSFVTKKCNITHHLWRKNVMSHIVTKKCDVTHCNEKMWCHTLWRKNVMSHIVTKKCDVTHCNEKCDVTHCDENVTSRIICDEKMWCHTLLRKCGVTHHLWLKNVTSYAFLYLMNLVRLVSDDNDWNGAEISTTFAYLKII